MIRYELRLPHEINPDDVLDYLREFEDNGEFCNVLWRLYEVGIDEWMREAMTDKATYIVGFYDHNVLVGMGRITPHPRHVENGNVGYAIRPSLRGKRYAAIMLIVIEDFCRRNSIDDIKACINSTNEKSMRAFEKVGWIPTGSTYVWSGNRAAIEYSPKRNKMTHNSR